MATNLYRVVFVRPNHMTYMNIFKCFELFKGISGVHCSWEREKEAGKEDFDVLQIVSIWLISKRCWGQIQYAFNTWISLCGVIESMKKNYFVMLLRPKNQFSIVWGQGVDNAAWMNLEQRWRMKERVQKRNGTRKDEISLRMRETFHSVWN